MERTSLQKKLFKKICCCLNHDLFTHNGEKKFSFHSNRSFRSRTEFKELVKRNLVPRNARTICDVCLNYGRKKYKEKKCVKVIDEEYEEREEAVVVVDEEREEIVIDEVVPSEEDTTENYLLTDIVNLKEKLKALDWNDVSEDVKCELSSLSFILGGVIRKSLSSERFKMASECSSFEGLLEIEKLKWYEGRNQLLRKFLEGCSGVDPASSSQKKINSLLHSVEQVMYTQNNNIITPFSFSRNIISYLTSKSRTVSSIMGMWESSGSYTRVVELLTKPSPPLIMPKNCDITVTFDNEQKVGRHSGRLREGSKQPTSIITTVATIKTNPHSTVQFDFQPFKTTTTTMELIDKVNRQEDIYRDQMRQYRASFMEEILKDVVQDQFIEEVTDDVKDFVDIAVSNSNSFVCKCKYIGIFFTTCPSCGNNSSFHPLNFDRYSRTNSCHLIEKPDVKHAEPYPKNPASFENVREVLKRINDEAIINTERKWVSIVCDGVPYVYASQIQDDTKLCETCHKIVLLDDLEDHSCTSGNQIRFSSNFEKLLLRPGPGHIELNMGRNLLKFLWHPFLEELSGRFGFRTPKAKLVFQKGSDHHRTQELLSTCLIALAKELLVPYVRYCVDIQSPATVNGYIEWYEKKVHSRRYAFLYNITFSYLLSFKYYNESVRKNNAIGMMAARTTFVPLFFGRNHPKYQRIMLRDMIQRVKYTNEVSAYMNSTESFSVSGENNRGQGGDFIHEEMNREIKSFLPPSGIPSEETWFNVIRKAEILKKMKNKLLTNSGIHFSSEKRSKQHQHEITMVRRLFRNANYFTDYNDKGDELYGLSGNELDSMLCNFNLDAIKNYKLYKQNFAKTGKYGGIKLDPVLITPDERKKFESIESKSIKEIKEKVEKIINEMPNKDVANVYSEDFKKLKKAKKHQYVSFFYESKTELEQQLADVIDCEINLNNNNLDEYE